MKQNLKKASILFLISFSLFSCGNNDQRILKDVEAEVEYDRLNRLVNLAVNLPNSTGQITFEFSDSDLRVTLSSNRGKSNFILPIEKRTEHLFRKPVSVKAEPMKRLLSSFNNLDKIRYSFYRL